MYTAYAWDYEAPESEATEAHFDNSFRVPRFAAEMTPTFSWVALFNNDGQRISSWWRVPHGSKRDHLLRRQSPRAKTLPHLRDVHGKFLSLEDFVYTPLSPFSRSIAVLCKVVGFSGKEVRLFDFATGRIISRKSNLTMKVGSDNTTFREKEDEFVEEGE